MKNSLLAKTIGGLILLTSLFGMAAPAQAASPVSGIYKCAQDPDNMIGQAPQFTVILQGSKVQVYYSTLMMGGFQIETARTHNNDLPKVTKNGDEFVFQAQLYSSEDAKPVDIFGMTLDTKNRVLYVSLGGYNNIPFSCK